MNWNRLVTYAEFMGRIRGVAEMSQIDGWLSTDDAMKRIAEIVTETELKLADIREIEELEAKTAPESTAGFLDLY